MASTGIVPENPRRVFGRRQGRKLRVGQQSLMETLYPRLTLHLPEAEAFDPAAAFAGQSLTEFWLEIGFGGGEHLAAQARQNPTVGLIGCEPFINGVVSLMQDLDRDGVAENLRVWNDDARKVIDALPDASLSRAFILFPDPWPKKRHNKRRFVQKDNLDALARVLKPGSELRMASDDMDYVAQMLAETCSHPAFRWTATGPDDWRNRPADAPATRYELKARAKGLEPAFLRFVRR
jgi:tRNA (guanine-N7-)-methyltransferase